MIISKTPFRISFAGGGTDLKAFYSKEYGCVTSTAINKYMYIAVHKYFDKRKILLKYSKTEFVDSIEKIEHPIFREALRLVGIESGIEITSFADIPSGSGLGSSCTFTVGLLHALYAYKGKFVSAERLAREAAHLEIDILGEPIGPQDQYAAAFGNLNHIRFNPDGKVDVTPIICNPETKMQLQKNLLLFYTGITRSTKTVLTEQQKNTETDSKKFENLQKMKYLAEELRDALNNNTITQFGEILHKGWLLKRELASTITNPDIDVWYETALRAGAIGGKLLGAGGGGFLLFYCPEEKKHSVIAALPLEHVSFDFDNNGSKIIYVGDK
jgi:D-glycero-alpha-D-manno-heptose-7-phosphate kinase